jgi:hypothetical protein
MLARFKVISTGSRRTLQQRPYNLNIRKLADARKSLTEQDEKLRDRQSVDRGESAEEAAVRQRKRERQCDETRHHQNVTTFTCVGQQDQRSSAVTGSIRD